jgi:hypothetical protein
MVHEQVIVKVNAPVDRGVRPLVSALNEFPNVITCESCEGDGEGMAFVSFRVEGDHQELADFVRNLSITIGNDGRLTDASYALALEWYAGGDTPLAYLRVPRRQIAAIAEAVSSAAAIGLHYCDRP